MDMVQDEKCIVWIKNKTQRVWYARLDNHLQHQRFKKGMMDNNLYIKIVDDHQSIVIVYVDDIIFDGCKEEICQEFVTQMQSEFEISMIRELSFFLVLQVSQLEKGIFISQIKCEADAEEVQHGRL